MEMHAMGKQHDDNEDIKHRKRPLRAELRDSLTVASFLLAQKSCLEFLQYLLCLCMLS